MVEPFEEQANHEDDSWRRRPGKTQRQQVSARQYHMRKFVAKHGLTCFGKGCKAAGKDVFWAKTGVRLRDMKPWAICRDCIDKRNKLQSARPESLRAPTV